MCGIAGYCLSAGSSVDRTLAAQALLAAIAERGSDAVGYAHRSPGKDTCVFKQRTGASALLGNIEIPDSATEVLLHVRDFTKGHPGIQANNHPIRHGDVIGIHNGVIDNDEQILARHGFERAEPEMTVDSEVIFALVDEFGPTPHALGQLRGSMASAWVDANRPGSVFLARGIGRPLWIGSSRHETFFASTRNALEIVERYLGLRMRKREIEEGIVVELVDGAIARHAHFSPDRSFRDAQQRPAVRAPRERELCLTLLATLAA